MNRTRECLNGDAVGDVVKSLGDDQQLIGDLHSAHTAECHVDTPKLGTLNEEERQQLSECEARIRASLDDLGKELDTINRNRLYREYGTFKDYVQKCFPDISHKTIRRKLNNYRFNRQCRKSKLPEATQAVTDILFDRRLTDKIGAYRDGLHAGCKTAKDWEGFVDNRVGHAPAPLYVPPKKPNSPKVKISLWLPPEFINLVQNNGWGKWRIRSHKMGGYVCRQSVEQRHAKDWGMVVLEKLDQHGIEVFDFHMIRARS